MLPFSVCAALALVATARAGRAAVNVQRAGWLDRVVQYHKNSLFADLQKLPPVHITASIKPAPDGYVDSPAWDGPSALRLLVLLQHSRQTQVLRQLRRAMLSSRRFMSFSDTFKAFPSLSKHHPNYFYYNVDSGEDGALPPEYIDDDVEESIVVIANPVEARLPAAQISVSLLRDILEARAGAARYMPTTARTIKWIPMSKGTGPVESATTDRRPAATTAADTTAATATSNDAGTTRSTGGDALGDAVATTGATLAT